MINTVASGSHGRLMHDIRDAVRPLGIEARIAYGRGAPGDADAFRFDTRADVLAHVLRTRALDQHAQGSRHATRRLLRAMDAFQPDLVHLHNIHGYYLHAQSLFAYLRARNLPTIWTLHDCWAFTGHCSHFVRADCARWREGCFQCPLKHAYPAAYGLDGSKRNWRWKKKAFASLPPLRIVSPSLWLDEMLGQSFLRDVPRQVISNGVDLSLFVPQDASDTRRALGIREGEALILAVASPFDERKGFADTLQAARRLQGRAHLVLVGLTDKQLRVLPPNVTGLARTDGPETLVSLYAAADCLMNATREDTYPTVNMEAMACGTPVVCYAVGGATEQLVPPAGRSVPVGEADALAEAALAAAREKPHITHACRQYALAHFDRAAALRAYAELYRSILL